MTTKRDIGYARSINEVFFFLELERCPRCGEREIGEPNTGGGLYGDDKKRGGEAFLTCPRCGHQRAVFYYKLPEYDDPFRPGHVGGPTPSQIILPHQFAKELAWCLRDIERELPKYQLMSKEQRRPNSALWYIGLKSVNELNKFIPEAAAEVPAEAFTTGEGRAYHAAHREEFTRTYLDASGTMLAAIRAEILRVSDAQEAARIAAGIERAPQPLPLPPFSLAALKFHEKWVAEGDVEGAQRMTGKGIDLRGRNLDGRDLSGSEFENINFDRANLARSKWRGAHLVGGSAFQTSFVDARITGATLERCMFSSATMTDVHLFDSAFLECSIIETDLSRSLWFRTAIGRGKVLRSSLVDASFDYATIADCDFSGSDFSVTRAGPIGTAVEARFVRCDLRNTNWAGRDLFRVTFIDCKLAGAHGTPELAETLIERPDLSPKGDGSQIGTRADVLRLWGIAEDPALTHRELVYDLTADDAFHMAAIARKHGLETRTWVVTAADGYRHGLRIRVPVDDTTSESMIQQEMVRQGHVVPASIPRRRA